MSGREEQLDSLKLSRREAVKRVALMLGVAVSSNGFAAALARRTASESLGEGPRYLTQEQYEAAAAFAERILPKTDTPGAIDVGVPQFIDLSYGKYLDESERGTLVEGLSFLDQVAEKREGKRFAELTDKTKDEILEEVSQFALDTHVSFWKLGRDLTLLGYYTSEVVGKEILNYDPIPGGFDPCVPLDSLGNRAWTH